MRLPLITVLALTACSEDPPGGGGPNVDSHVQLYDLPGRSAPKFDLLIVVDNTTAMDAYQTQLAALGAEIETAFSGGIGVLPDLRVGVTTTNAATAGTIAPYLESALTPDFQRTMNFQGTLGAALAAQLAVGATSTASTQPLEAAKVALDANPALTRDHAYLGVVTIAASDDASPGTPATYATALKARKADTARVLAVGIHPMPSTRLDSFHTEFPNRSDTVDIDEPWVDALALFASAFKITLGAPCAEEPLDVDPDTAGAQYDCALAAYFSDDTTAPLPQCAPTGGPARCFEFVTDASICTEPGSKRVVLRGFADPFYPGVRGECVVD